ncbi:hypothetical protein RUM43_004484 [Polyplax serrata]|uniref:Uncharacterized protein n=1 Tax=Polyplax serrata TaxID=468196 RepID=A0AAN8SBJ2_POLSC
MLSPLKFSSNPVRITVPGAERRLKERHGLAGEYLVQHQNKYQRHEPDTSGSLTSGLSSKCFNKVEVLAEGELEGLDSTILFTKPAPDICSSNPGVTAEEVITFAGPPLVSQEGTFCLKSSEPPFVLDESTTFPIDSSQMNLNSPLAGQTVPIVLMNSCQRSAGSTAGFMYPPVKSKEKGNIMSSTLGEAAGCCLNKSEVRHSVNTLPSRRFRNCMQTNTLGHGAREMVANFEDQRGSRRFDYTNLTHMSPTDIDSGGCTFFETFHNEGAFIQPGILRVPLDIPGTSSTTSSSSGGTGSGMTMTTGSSASSSSRTGYPQEKKKKKVVTIGNVFSTMDTFESNVTEADPFDSGSVV